MSDGLGYYREPALHGDRLIFVCEADLWTAPLAGGRAHRLTALDLDASSPRFSPDGETLAFIGREEGATELYTMPAAGGPARRLTFQGAPCLIAGWAPDGSAIVIASSAEQPMRRGRRLWSVPRDGGAPELLPWGPADRLTHGPGGARVLGRNVGDPARWKRYRGGTAGDLWIDPEGRGEFQRLIQLKGNLADPLWVGERVYFLSDHEGHGNLYSCTPAGEDLQRHSNHEDFYARNASTDGTRIVYQSGARIHCFDPAGGEPPRGVELQVASAKPQLARRFAGVAQYLSAVDLHPRGHSLALTVRGRPFTLGNWEEAVLQHGERDGVRYRLTRWLHDGERLVTVSDAGGEEALEVHRVDGSEPSRRLADLDIGRPFALEVSPCGDQVVVANQRFELLWVDLAAGTSRVLDTSAFGRMRGLAWSPDGRWVAYGFAGSSRTTHLRLAAVASGTVHAITEPVHVDGNPSFDPGGKFLYFISYRSFDPVYDRLYFDLGFPRGGRPYLVTLQADVRSPFRPPPRPLGGDGDKQDAKKQETAEGATGGAEPGESGKPEPVRVDLEGIAGRVLAFPVDEANYLRVIGLKDKVVYDRWPVEGSLDADWLGDPEPKGELFVYDLKKQKEERLVEGVSELAVSLDRKTLAYRAGKRLRVLEAGSKPEGKAKEPGRESGWVDLGRVRVELQPAAEWRQMYREAWRLQRDNFWTPDMAGVDWNEVYERYLPLLERVATRSEFSDLMWEVQGELGTSHAYEFGGDRRAAPPHGPGYLGADLRRVAEQWVVERVVRGDSWQAKQDSPLAAPGLDVRAGDRVLAIDGRELTGTRTPGELLLNRAGIDVQVSIQRGDEAPRRVTVRTLGSETDLRYRAWVEATRAAVHEATAGAVGYLHVPDMGPRGFSEFHRYYQQEIDRQGLIVDVRYNGGGHVSQLLLEKLARRRIGYDIPRYGMPVPYPEDAVFGPLVCLTNELAGSDGDIFSHCFKLMGLGTLVGKRTWGGVVGIWPRHPLVDRTITTQAEFAFWFKDVGWTVENYGTDPDIDVDIAPQDWAAGRDPQLTKGLEVIAGLLAENPAQIPDFGPRPSRKAPRLPR